MGAIYVHKKEQQPSGKLKLHNTNIKCMRAIRVSEAIIEIVFLLLNTQLVS